MDERTRGRPRIHVAAASHGRVEQARQQLVNAEEAYLRANEWERQLVGQEWLWAIAFGGIKLVLTRTEAVKFQHHAESAAK